MSMICKQTKFIKSHWKFFAVTIITTNSNKEIILKSIFAMIRATCLPMRFIGICLSKIPIAFLIFKNYDQIEFTKIHLVAGSSACARLNKAILTHIHHFFLSFIIQLALIKCHQLSATTEKITN